ncbi:transporter [Nonomuraea sp. K274]|uniref:Transporter n=1 Tax=Nonomuraea cypriaca TaxID=1187855 RepID=A0A931AHT1_9ACTN|nr:transporter [Nonomuraea cypriaca]MBF8190559.1 transporter [Nonomuraea cypriaca]
MVDDERSPTPEEVLRVIKEQNSATVRLLGGNPMLVYVPWGVAWLLGFTAYFLHLGLSGEPYAPISEGQALGVLMVGLIVAGAVSARGYARSSKLVRGDSSARGTMYGLAFFAGMMLMAIIAGRISPHLPPGESGLLWAGMSMMVVATLYMAGGAIWLNWPMFFAGVWVAVVNGVGVVLGAAWHALLMAVLVGGGFIVFGLWLRRRG